MRIIINLYISILLASCAPKAPRECGFKKNTYGEIVRWYQLPVVVYIDNNVPDSKVSAIYKAASKWDGALGRQAFEIRRGSGLGISKNNLNVISYVTNWQQPRQATMVTSAWGNGNQILEADIGINSQYYTFYGLNEFIPGAFSMETLATHELGHVLGLAHQDTNTKSVMYPYLGANQEIPLSQLDMENIRCGYN